MTTEKRPDISQKVIVPVFTVLCIALVTLFVIDANKRVSANSKEDAITKQQLSETNERVAVLEKGQEQLEKGQLMIVQTIKDLRIENKEGFREIKDIIKELSE